MSQVGAAIAHSANAQGLRHDLEHHLRAVSTLAEGFAKDLGAAEIGRLLGLWHDIGKYHPDFQRYLQDSEAGSASRRGSVDHKAAGAYVAARYLGPLALLVQGHHGGLRSPSEFQGWLAHHNDSSALDTVAGLAMSRIADLEPACEPQLPSWAEADPLSADLFMRLLFSALVDADYLDTEAHFAPETAHRRGSKVELRELWSRLEASQSQLSGKLKGTVPEARHAIYQACLRAAALPTGVFRLTVPTGGGKTRSAMAFALRHALAHGQRRVIVAIPFISITEQTAQEYRHIFEEGSDAERAVLEHHSQVVTEPSGEADSMRDSWLRLAAENWDAPIIVTTTVQLFESLFSNGPAKTRKLHRLANSVIILDEAQSLPSHLLQPILDVLLELSRNYNTTVVLSTATQPAFESIPGFRSLRATEIVPEPERFFQALRRVQYEWRVDPGAGWEDIATLLRHEDQALVVVNTKRDALALLDVLDDPSVLHLSTLLCGAHRRTVIQEVKRRLSQGKACRLVSTQVVEAGVDLDFPVVMRAMGPLDAIIQAAGRCNREGRRRSGRAIVFSPTDGHLPRGAYTTATDVTRAMLGTVDLDLHDSATTAGYFSRLYGLISTDRERIQELRQSFNFPEVARKFKMIEDDTESVAVTYGTEDERAQAQRVLRDLRAGYGNPRLLLRQLQPYLVSLRKWQAGNYRGRGLLQPVAPGLSEWLGAYDPIRGITDRDLDPADLVI
jgi:CRISPR-associated endonuclease/helicase Cas3